MYDFLIIGGDLRHLYLRRLLEQQGFQTITAEGERISGFSLENGLEGIIKSSHVILCPMPFTKDKKTVFSAGQGETVTIAGLLKYMTNEHILFGGSIPDFVKDSVKQKNILCYDFMDMEEIAIANSIATAEGAIAEALRLSPGCIHKSQCLVTGFGRCGRTLACKLNSLSATVTVADRKPSKLAEADALGLKTIGLPEFTEGIDEYDFIFNTIPAPILNQKQISLLRPDVTIIDIASAPGGVDFPACQSLKICARLCPGLPGIYGPKAAAEILSKAILKCLS